MILHSKHLDDLRKSGHSDETIQQAGIRSVPPDEINRIFGYETFAQSCCEIPYGGGYSRYRMFYSPENQFKKDGSERPKYLSVAGTGNRLYIPARAKEVLQDVSVPLFITEGEKKALKACQEGIPCIAIAGLWNWSDGDKELISDFNEIALEGRSVYIVPDSHFQEPDRHGKPKNLKQAVRELAYRLIDKGSKVYWVQLPQGDTEIKLDDYLSQHTVEDFHNLPKYSIRRLTIQEEIGGISAETPVDGIKTLLKRIASEVSSHTERELFEKEIKGKTGITLTSMRKDIAKFGGNQDDNETHAEMLIGIARGYKLFHDEVQEGYAYIDNVAVRIRSGRFKRLISRELYITKKIAPGTDAIAQALNIIEAMAVNDNECIRLYNKVAECDGIFYYDLGDGRAVKASGHGWEVTDKFPILFKQYSHQQAQVEPKRGGNIKDLFRFINIKDEAYRLLTSVYLISCYIPNIPHPIFHPHGDQGAGKTLTFACFKKLIEPSKVDSLITPRSPEEVVQQLEHHYLTLFDNISSFPDWLSDLLCQACTGGGFSKRKLFTDNEDIIYQLLRCVGLNGINLLVSRADLMDRTILLRMERIEPSERKELKVLLEEFEKERPYILGCFFDALSRAMANYPGIKLSNLPRMADFMRWGVAIAIALGYEANDFIQAYQANINAQNSEVINSNTLAQAVLTFMQEQEGWSGTVKEGYEELGRLVVISKDDRTFPKHFNKLRSHLNRIKSNLLDHGIKFNVEDFNRTKKGIPLSFQKVAKVSTPSTPSAQASKDKAFAGVDTVYIQKVSTPVSTPLETSKVKGSVDGVDSVDKKPTFRSGVDFEKNLENIPENSLEHIEI